jgi:hypothetical protein
VRSFIQSKVHIESEKGRAAPLTAIEILMQNNCAKAAINFVCLADKDKGSSAVAKLTGSGASRSQSQGELLAISREGHLGLGDDDNGQA